MLRKKMVLGLLSVLMFAALLTGCAAGAAAAPAGGGPGYGSSAAQVGAPAGQGITVVGSGKVYGSPDVAYISIGVETEADSVQKAVDDNKANMNALLEALKSQGVADKDLRTDNYSVSTMRQPVMGSDTKGQTGPVTYHVSNMVQVTVRDMSKLSTVLDKAVAAGANTIYGVNFGVSDTSALENDARAKAMADAKARAQSLAQLAGVSLGSVSGVSEVINNPGLMYDMRNAAASGLGGGGASIQPGQMQVVVNVQVTYAIK